MANLGHLSRAKMALAVCQTLHHSPQDNFSEGDKEGEYQPVVNQLCVRGRGQLLDLAGEDGGDHQHDGQVHRQRVSNSGVQYIVNQ